mmetsp:Transcript_61135/g.171014  ORF Transcript_61135/g.171014 Transcript_61135/m.171014 type:complete len:220 (+) Transcript_61135:1342-2001(+)
MRLEGLVQDRVDELQHRVLVAPSAVVDVAEFLVKKVHVRRGELLGSVIAQLLQTQLAHVGDPRLAFADLDDDENFDEADAQQPWVGEVVFDMHDFETPHNLVQPSLEDVATGEHEEQAGQIGNVPVAVIALSWPIARDCLRGGRQLPLNARVVREERDRHAVWMSAHSSLGPIRVRASDELLEFHLRQLCRFQEIFQIVLDLPNRVWLDATREAFVLRQ